MNPEALPPLPSWMLEGIEDGLRAIRRTFDELIVARAADPDGKLQELSQVLEAKRGCRR